MARAAIEQYRVAASRNGRDRFSCPAPVWELLEELGVTFGWHPGGTTYTGARRRIDDSLRHTYQPGDMMDSKRVGADDASAWASALAVAKDSPHLAAMLQARAAGRASRGEVASDLLPGVLEQFIDFARGGAFTFSIERDAASATGEGS